MQLWQQPCVWGSWLHTVLAWAGKELGKDPVEAWVPQAYFLSPGPWAWLQVFLGFELKVAPYSSNFLVQYPVSTLFLPG